MDATTTTEIASKDACVKCGRWSTTVHRHGTRTCVTCRINSHR